MPSASQPRSEIRNDFSDHQRIRLAETDLDGLDVQLSEIRQLLVKLVLISIGLLISVLTGLAVYSFQLTTGSKP